MESRSTELKVGITITLAVILLLAGVAWVGQYRLTKRGFPVAVEFENVGGLDEGDPVTVSGMERGRVERIELRPRAVRVWLWLEPDVVLDGEAEIAIENIGMMGEKYVAIRRGGSPRPMDVTEVQRGVYRPGLMEMMAELGDMVEVVREEVGGLSAALSGTSGKSLGQLLEKLDRTLSELSEVVSENRGDVREAVRGFRAASEEARELISETREDTRGTVSGVNSAVESVEETTAEIRDLVRSLQDVVQRIEEGEGTLGTVINDRNLHDELVRTLRDLDALLQDIKENPRRYFGVSVF